MNAPRIFDAEHYESLNASRAEVVSHLLNEVKNPLALRTAIDVGCGLGYFSKLLASHGLEVTAVDGRQQNVEEAQARHPGIQFRRFDAEDSSLRSLGQFDLVFCFGLLYHLENPLLAVRHLHAMAKTLLLVEGVIFPGDEPIMGLVDEAQADDQGLNHFAFYPTEACLEKMLYRAGFSFVYRFEQMPEHPDYQDEKGTPKVRTMLGASRAKLTSKLLKLVPEPKIEFQPWDVYSVLDHEKPLDKLRRFAGKSLPQKVKTLKRLMKGRT